MRAEERHQRQLAPMTNGSRKVRYAEKTVPRSAENHAPSRLKRREGPSPRQPKYQSPVMATYPAMPSTPTGRSPKSRAYSLCWTVLQSPTGPQTARAPVVSMTASLNFHGPLLP